MKNALIRDFSPETKRGGTNISNIIKAAILWVWLALTQGVHAKSNDDIVDDDIVTVNINWNTFNYKLWDEDLLATCDKYMDKSEKLLEDCITWAETAMEAQADKINITLASSEKELASSEVKLKKAQARNEQTKKDMDVAKKQMKIAKDQMDIAEKEANRVYKQERKNVLAN